MKSNKNNNQDNTEEDIDFDLDFGNLNMSDLDLKDFNLSGPLVEADDRYVKPTIHPISENFVMYDNALKLAKNIKMGFASRYDCIISGSFIFGDFIEAFFVENNIYAPSMTISTLSLSQENIDSLKNLLDGGYLGELNLIISSYFYSNEKHRLVPYAYKNLDKNNRFQLAVAGIHTKTCTFVTEGGKHIVIHGSANLRSSANIEQFTIEENKDLFSFYNDYSSKILKEYATIRKKIRVSKLWNLIDRKSFDS